MQEMTETEAAVFTVAQNNADISLKELARLARVKHHTARYALNKLIEQKRLQLFPLIRFSRMGMSTYIITLGVRGDAKIGDILSFLSNIEGCSWTAFYSGPLAIEAWFLAHSPTQLQTRIREIVDGLNSRVAVKDITLLTGYRFYGRRYFTPRMIPIEPIESEMPGRIRFEHSDHLALQILQAQCLQGKELRRSIPALPDSTLRYRLARLRKEGVLACMRLTVAQTLRTREMIGIYISDVTNPEILSSKLDAWARATPELVSVCSGIGKFEQKISIEVKKDSDMRPLLDSLIAACGRHIGSIECRVLMDMGTHTGYPFKEFPLDTNSGNSKILL